MPRLGVRWRSPPASLFLSLHSPAAPGRGSRGRGLGRCSRPTHSPRPADNESCRGSSRGSGQSQGLPLGQPRRSFPDQPKSAAGPSRAGPLCSAARPVRPGLRGRGWIGEGTHRGKRGDKGGGAALQPPPPPSRRVRRLAGRKENSSPSLTKENDFCCVPPQTPPESSGK